MSRTILIVTGLFFSLGLFAQGVEFSKDSWDEILQMAQKEKKVIFMDAYTVWCGPCKKMAREVFPQEEVGAFYNQNFINVKMDMEKGEGVMLGDRYHVMAYPTLLYIDSDGTLLHRVAGYHSVPQFLEVGKTALDPTRRLSALNARYMQGDRDPEFLYNYTMIRYEAMDGSHVKIAEEYLKTQKDWGGEKNMQFLFSFTENANSPQFDYMVQNREKFVEMFGQQAFTSKVQTLIYSSVSDSENNSGIDQVDRLFAKAYPEKAEELSSAFRVNYYRQIGNNKEFGKAAVAHFKKYPTEDPDQLNDIAWTFYEVVEDKDMLKEAVKWAKKSVKVNSNYYNNDTLAALYFKLQKKCKARKAANKAIDIARETGEDYSLTEELLKEIEAL